MSKVIETQLVEPTETEIYYFVALRNPDGGDWFTESSLYRNTTPEEAKKRIDASVWGKGKYEVKILSAMLPVGREDSE